MLISSKLFHFEPDVVDNEVHIEEKGENVHDEDKELEEIKKIQFVDLFVNRLSNQHDPNQNRVN
jgi:hypothetical protein